MHSSSNEFRIAIFADGADKAGMLAMYDNPMISGFTTNPTLMRKAGLNDYRHFARDILSVIKDKPISFEVISDSFGEMEKQAREISSWGDNVIVKIPVTNTRRESSFTLIERLVKADVQVNVTAIMTVKQVRDIVPALSCNKVQYVSVFAGRIADTGRDPIPIMTDVIHYLKEHPNIKLIWASPREILNVIQAEEIGCDVITVTFDLLKKLSSHKKDLEEFSLETVKMFYNDAVAAGYTL